MTHYSPETLKEFAAVLHQTGMIGASDANDIDRHASAWEAERRDMLEALMALLGIDNPDAPDIGHVDYVRAVSIARAALVKAGG